MVRKEAKIHGYARFKMKDLDKTEQFWLYVQGVPTNIFYNWTLQIISFIFLSKQTDKTKRSDFLILQGKSYKARFLSYIFINWTHNVEKTGKYQGNNPANT